MTTVRERAETNKPPIRKKSTVRAKTAVRKKSAVVLRGSRATRAGAKREGGKGLAGIPVSIKSRLLGLERAGKSVNMVQEVRKGFSFIAIERLADELDMRPAEFGERYLDMSPSTISRRRQRGYLSAQESDRAARYARLIAQATELHEGDEEGALRWLTTPLPIFSGETPLDYARSEEGFREVEALITRLEYGMFS